jgi:DNA-binding transcriptional MerR regulator
MVQTINLKKRQTRREVKPWRTVQIDVNGVRTSMFTIGALANAVGKAISTLRVWEEKGLLPETPYRTAQGARLYSLELMQQVQQSLEQCGKLVSLRQYGGNQAVTKTIQLEGKAPQSAKLYKVGVLALAINRTVQAVYQMEERSAIPLTPFIASAQGYRLYTIEMIEAVQRVFEIRPGSVRGPLEWQCVFNEITRDWKKLGILGARLIDKY